MTALFFLMTLYVIVIVRLKTEWRNLVTDAKNAVTFIVIIRRDCYKKMMEIERMFNDNMALLNIYDVNPLRHNDDKYCQQIVILV